MITNLAQCESDVVVFLLHQLAAQEEILFVLGTCFNLFACVSACVLSCFSHVWLFATPRGIVLQAPLPMGFPSKNTGAGCHFLFWESSQPRDQTRVSGILCIGRRVLYHWTTWEAHTKCVWCSRWRSPRADQHSSLVAASPACRPDSQCSCFSRGQL